MSALDHSQLDGKEGTRFEFTTYGCPNVTITRNNLKDGGGIDVHSSQEVNYGEGILKHMKVENETKVVNENTFSSKSVESGLTAILEDTFNNNHYEYIVKVNYITNGKDHNGFHKFEKDKTLAANKCFIKYVPKAAAPSPLRGSPSPAPKPSVSEIYSGVMPSVPSGIMPSVQLEAVKQPLPSTLYKIQLYASLEPAPCGTSTSVSEPSNALPEGWEEYQTPNGRTAYTNGSETQWNRPKTRAKTTRHRRNTRKRSTRRRR
jgi:hypothetical protein